MGITAHVLILMRHDCSAQTPRITSVLPNVKAEKREAAFSSRWLAVRDFYVPVDANSAG